MSIELSVVIPAFNEAGRIGPTLERVVRYLERSGRGFEVLVVNDGSLDRTADVVKEFAARRVWLLDLNRNRGKGAALRHGVVATSGRIVLLTDADLSTPIEELERLEPWLADAALVLGSRAHPDSRIDVHQPRHRELMGKMFNVAIRCLGLVSFRDTQCGFKLLDGEIARAVFPDLAIDGFAYDVELVFEIERRGYRVVEVGVEWNDDGASRVQPMRHAPEMLRDVIALKLRRRRE